MSTSPGPWPAQPPPGYQPGPPPERPEQPTTIRAAVATMWLGAVLSVLGGILPFLVQDQIRDAVEDQLANQPDSGLDVDTLVTIGLFSAAIGGVIGAGLWILHAVYIGKGRSWARIVGTVLFAITFLFFFYGLVQPAPAISRVSAVINLMVAIAAVVLIWLTPSSRYIDASERAARGY